MIHPSLDQASTIIEASFVKGLELNAKPLTVAVLDQGGQLRAFQRQDGSSLLRPEIALGKAWGALGMGQNSRQLAQVATERPSFMAAAIAASGGRLVPVPGGVLLREVAGGDPGLHAVDAGSRRCEFELALAPLCEQFATLAVRTVEQTPNLWRCLRSGAAWIEAGKSGSNHEVLTAR